MTSIREAIRRRLSGPKPPARSPSGISYGAHWADLARSWTPDRQRAVLQQLRRLLESPDFCPTEFERRYVVVGVDEIPHAGASLMALRAVLEVLLTET